MQLIMRNNVLVYIYFLVLTDSSLLLHLKVFNTGLRKESTVPPRARAHTHTHTHTGTYIFLNIFELYVYLHMYID